MPKKIDEDKLFLAVVGTIGQMGIQRSTTKEIARSAGVNEVTLFRRYGSKSGLIKAAFQHILESSPLQELAYSGDLEEDLVRIVKAYKETSFLYGEIIPMILSGSPPDHDSTELLEPFLNVVKAITRIIQRYQHEGELKNEPGFSAVSSLLGPVIISKMLQRAQPDFEAGEISEKAYIEAFLDGRRQK